MCRSLLPKRPPSRQTEADIWTMLLGWSPRLHSALKSAQCVNTHTRTPTTLMSATLQCVSSGGRTGVVGLHCIVEHLRNVPAATDPGSYGSCTSVALCCWQSENETKNSQGVGREKRINQKDGGVGTGSQPHWWTDRNWVWVRKVFKKCFHVFYCCRKHGPEKEFAQNACNFGFCTQTSMIFHFILNFQTFQETMVRTESFITSRKHDRIEMLIPDSPRCSAVNVYWQLV